MFLGKFSCDLDDDYRILTPAGFKKYISNDMYITQGFDNNLWVFSNNAFQEIYKKLARLNIADPLARMLFRLILGEATEVGVNSQGYLKIPEALREYALIENEALLVGQGEYFEIWSPKLWNKQEQELRNAELNTNRFSTFELTTQ